MNLEAFDLTGRVALVTGAAQGLGAAMAIGLCEAGAAVALVDARPLDATGDTISTLGGASVAIEQDLAGLTADAAVGVVDACVRQLGRLDILVNCAGIIRRSPALDMTEEDWSAVVDIDLTAVFFLCQAAARHFIQMGKPGKIINVASMLSFQGGIQVASYAAAKSGVGGLTRALSNEWAPLDINVNAIAPGYFATEVTAAIRSDPERETAVLSRIPAGRWGEPTDLKGAVVFLASDASRYVHGTILPVDGGWLAR